MRYIFVVTIKCCINRLYNMQSVFSPIFFTLFFSRIIRIVEIGVDECNIRLVWKIASSSLQLIEVHRNSVINDDICQLYSSLLMWHISFISSQGLNVQEGLCNSLHWAVFLINWHVQLQIIKGYVPSTILLKIVIFTSSICLIICKSKLFSSVIIVDDDGSFHIQLIVIRERKRESYLSIFSFRAEWKKCHDWKGLKSLIQLNICIEQRKTIEITGLSIYQEIQLIRHLDD